MQEDAGGVQFVDVSDPGMVRTEIDLDSVVLTERQKLRLVGQALKTKIFWQIYAMQFCTICKYLSAALC